MKYSLKNSNKISCVNTTFIAYIELILSMIFLGSTLVMGKTLITIFPIFLLLAFRFAIGSTVLSITCYLHSDKRQIFRLNSISYKDWGLLFLQAFFGAFLFNLLMLLGLQKTTANAAAIITSTIPAFITFFAFLLLHETVSRYKWFAIFIAILGLMLVTSDIQWFSVQFGSLEGNGFVLLAVLSGALFPICTKRLSDKIPPRVISLFFNLFGLFLFLPIAVQETFSFAFKNIPLTIWILTIFYSITANVLYLVFWNRGLQKTSASSASLFTAVMPVSTAVLSYLFLGEILSILQIMGMLCVLLAIFFGIYRT
ncbi:MAG: DMT family transporter [Gammaproteobacteria bacterium]